MSAFLSIHGVAKLAASTVQGGEHNCSPHITLDFEGDSFENRGSVTLYIADAVLTARLIETINATIAERKAELAAENQEAA